MLRKECILEYEFYFYGFPYEQFLTVLRFAIMKVLRCQKSYSKI